MSINKDNLVEVNHPGDAKIFNYIEYQIVNGEQEVLDTSLYWEDTYGELVKLKDGAGRNSLSEEGSWYEYGSDGIYQKLSSAWVDPDDNTLHTFFDYIQCKASAEYCKPIFDDPETIKGARTLNHRDSSSNNPGRVKDQQWALNQKD